MHPGGISVERDLPIDGALLGDVLLRLRRDSPASALRWTLGDRGAAEVEVAFASEGPSWTTRARLWNYAGLGMTTATVRLEPVAPDTVRMTLEPTISAGSPTGDDELSMSDLGQATVDELAEELLWHATRAGLTFRDSEID
jgi:hypothetical protein